MNYKQPVCETPVYMRALWAYTGVEGPVTKRSLKFGKGKTLV